MLTDLLRKELGFDGILITDDLEMGAIAKYHEGTAAAVASFAAGADVLLICANQAYQEKTIDALVKALKDGDVPLYVERGAADLGVCGLDQVLESGADLLTPIDFGFGRCRLCLAAPRGSRLVSQAALAEEPALPAAGGGHRPEHLSDAAELGRSLRVATKYPRLSAKWFARRGVPVDLVALSGSVELAAVAGLTDAIVDLVESGRTLEENGLVVVDELLQVSARLVVNRAAYRLKVEALLPLLEALG